MELSRERFKRFTTTDQRSISYCYIWSSRSCTDWFTKRCHRWYINWDSELNTESCDSNAKVRFRLLFVGRGCVVGCVHLLGCFLFSFLLSVSSSLTSLPLFSFLFLFSSSSLLFPLFSSSSSSSSSFLPLTLQFSTLLDMSNVVVTWEWTKSSWSVYWSSSTLQRDQSSTQAKV